MTIILTKVTWYLKVVLTFISQMFKDVEHFQKQLLAVCVSSFVMNSLFDF